MGLRSVIDRIRHAPAAANASAESESVTASPLDSNPLAAIGQLELLSRRMVDGLLSGKHRSTHRGGCTDFTEHRQYSSGDDVRMIDWRLHARNDRYHIKQYEDETNLKALVFVDSSGSMGFAGQRQDGTAAATKFDTAKVLASCFARLLIRQRDAVGLAVGADRVEATLPPRVRAGSIQQMNKLLGEATLQGESNLGRCLTELASQHRRRGMLILISDCFCSLPELKSGLNLWAQRGHDVLVVEVVAHDEVEFDFRESLVLQCLERPGTRLEIDPGNVRNEYLRRMRQHRRELGQIVSGCGGDLMRVRTDSPIGEVMQRFLQRRTAKLGKTASNRSIGRPTR